MKIVIAPDKFKDCLTAREVCDAIVQGIRSVDTSIEIDAIPMADGGEGTVDALVNATGGTFQTARVTGPLPDMKVDAQFGLIDNGQIAVVEMAAACGLALLDQTDRNPFRTTSYGAGELLVAAAKTGAKKIILGIGGSATVDGGIGVAQACGLPVILDETGPADIREPLVGEDLRRIVLVKHARGGPLDRIEILVASDVTNPLCGEHGAARVFGPQKGATQQQVEELDALLHRLAQRCDKLDIAAKSGAGAAGGLGFAMLAFFNAKLRPGFEIVADAVRLRERLHGADLCITGEGRLDSSSLHGKTPVAVAKLCRELNIPCIAIAGAMGDAVEAESSKLFSQTISIRRSDMSLEESMRNARPHLTETAAQIVRRVRS